jgi:hypothetical protein
MPQMGFEPMTPVFKLAKTVCNTVPFYCSDDSSYILMLYVHFLYKGQLMTAMRQFLASACQLNDPSLYEKLFMIFYIIIISDINNSSGKAGRLAVFYMPDLAMVQMFLRSIQSMQYIIIIPFRVWNFVSSSINVKEGTGLKFPLSPMLDETA